MRRHSPDAEIPADARGAAIALGNFDGVHLGHQGVIASARAVAEQRSIALGAAAFEPHPRRLFQPDAPSFRLQTRDQRARALAAIGVKELFKIRFDRALASMTDAEFAEQILAKHIGAAHVSVGFDFRYGRGRMGDAESLRGQGRQFGFSVDIVSPISGGDGEKVSSSAIRDAITRGDMSEAARMLTRPWAIEGEVLRGFQRGRELGVPTANIALGDYMRPRFGVYAVRVDIGDGLQRAGAASIGLNPTIGALNEPMVEAHLLNFDGDLYGRTVEVALVAFLRDEAKFDDLGALKAQMAEDIARTRTLLS